MNKKTRYLAIAIIAITGLSLVPIPAMAIEYMHIEIEPQGEVEGSTILCLSKDHPSFQLGGYIKSNVPVMVMIYDENSFLSIRRKSKLIYCNENCSHQIDERIEIGFVKVIVTNNQPDTANVSYYLKAGFETIRLSHVKK